MDIQQIDVKKFFAMVEPRLEFSTKNNFVTIGRDKESLAIQVRVKPKPDYVSTGSLIIFSTSDQFIKWAEQFNEALLEDNEDSMFQDYNIFSGYDS